MTIEQLCSESFYRYIYRYILRKVRNVQLAEDLTQTTFEKACKYFPRLQERCSEHAYGGWLHAIATRVLIDSTRRYALKLERGDCLSLEWHQEAIGIEEMSIPDESEPDPEEQIIGRETAEEERAFLLAMVAQMQPAHQSVLHCEWSGTPVEDREMAYAARRCLIERAQRAIGRGRAPRSTGRTRRKAVA